MKRLFCLLLCLLCLSTAALAETSTEITAEATVYDLGDLTIGVPAGAVVQEGEKTAGAAFFAVYPYYDATQAFNDNYNIVWVPQDFSLLFAQTADKPSDFHCVHLDPLLVMNDSTRGGRHAIHAP